MAEERPEQGEGQLKAGKGTVQSAGSSATNILLTSQP